MSLEVPNGDASYENQPLTLAIEELDRQQNEFYASTAHWFTQRDQAAMNNLCAQATKLFFSFANVVEVIVQDETNDIREQATFLTTLFTGSEQHRIEELSKLVPNASFDVMDRSHSELVEGCVAGFEEGDTDQTCQLIVSQYQANLNADINVFLAAAQAPQPESRFRRALRIISPHLLEVGKFSAGVVIGGIALRYIPNPPKR